MRTLQEKKEGKRKNGLENEKIGPEDPSGNDTLCVCVCVCVLVVVVVVVPVACPHLFP